MTYPLLSITTFLPLIGVVLILLTPRSQEKIIKITALLISGITFIVSLLILEKFDSYKSGFQLLEQIKWFSGYNITYRMGIDGISIFFILLTTLLIPLCVLASWESITTKVKEYMISFLIMETFVIGSFSALDFVLFYVFFEAVLIPMFLIIGIWGGKNRVYAAFKFFLYTLLGSVLLLLALLYIYGVTGTTNMEVLMQLLPKLPVEVQCYLWLAFFASFAVKVPMWPVHTWLPDAHVEAPTAGSVILAGILLKLGAYGFLRFSLPMLPDASHIFADKIYMLSIIAVIYTSLVALMQDDMKKLIAYSSVAHMGFVTAGIFSFTQQGIEGALFQMISHGLVSAALFLCVGVVYDRMHTRAIKDYGGLVNRMPTYALFFMVFMLASVGLPGTSGFIGEFLVMVGVFKDNKIVAALIATGVILGAAYMLWLYRRVVFGEIENKKLADISDVNLREVIIFAPIAALVILYGIMPSLLLEYFHTPVKHLIKMVMR